MPLTDEETAVVSRLSKAHDGLAANDELLDAYYEGAQRLQQIGIAVPPELRHFETVVNWPRLVVDSLEERCDVKSFIRGGSDTADSGLREGWDANNLDSEFHLTFLDMLVYGRGFLSVGTNEDDPGQPLVSVESPRELVVDIDTRTRRVRSALRRSGGDDKNRPKFATLYTPTQTVWVESVGPTGSQVWDVVDRDVHNIGRVPVVPFFNRRRSGRWEGVSEIVDAIPLTDSAARSLTNLQIAAELHSVPQKWVMGMSKGDFVDPTTGRPKPEWEAYYGAIWANQNKDVKVGQFEASDLKNFHETVEHYASILAGLYGLPMRYFGLNTANPPSADGIRADEARLVKRAERKMSTVGDQLGRTMAMYERFRTGRWPESGDRIKVEWHDASTPTYAAKVDGIQKLTGGQPVLSREGGWDELGWSDARKDRERAYMAQEASDPILERLTREVTDAAAPGGRGGSAPVNSTVTVPASEVGRVTPFGS